MFDLETLKLLKIRNGAKQFFPRERSFEKCHRNSIAMEAVEFFVLQLVVETSSLRCRINCSPIKGAKTSAVNGPCRGRTRLIDGDCSKFRRFEVKAQFNEKQTQKLVGITLK